MLNRTLFTQKETGFEQKPNKKKKQRGNKNVGRITRKEHHQKKFCFMFWWIVGFDITQIIIIQLLEKIEYFSTFPLTSYCSLLVVVEMHIDNQIKITLKNKSEIQKCMSLAYQISWQTLITHNSVTVFFVLCESIPFN